MEKKQSDLTVSVAMMLAVAYWSYFNARRFTDALTLPDTTDENLPNVVDIILPSGSREDIRNNILPSINRTVVLALNRDGNLVIRRLCDDTIIWEKVLTWGRNAQEVSMEGNGSLTVYGRYGHIYWQTNTTGNPGADLRLQNNGFLCVFKDGRCIWSNEHRAPLGCPFPLLRAVDPSGTILRAGETSNPTYDVLESPNRQFKLTFNYASNLVVLRKSDNVAVWVGLAAGNGRRLTFELDGNLVVYGGNKSAGSEYVAWASETSGNHGTDLRLENDGHLCVFKDGRCVWSNGVGAGSTTIAPRDPNESDIIMRSGQALDNETFVLYSAQRKVSLGFNYAGDLTIRKQCDDKLLWWKILKRVGTKVAMEVNGNFVVYHGEDKRVGFESGTVGNPGADLRLQDDGHLCVFHNGRCIWSNEERFDVRCAKIYTRFFTTTTTPAWPVPVETEPDPSGIILRAGEIKNPQLLLLQSPNKTAVLTFDDEHDIVVKKKSDGLVLWKTKVWGYGRAFGMELDGNFMVYGGPDTNSSYARWHSNTGGHPGADLRLGDDGYLCVYFNRTCIWSNIERKIGETATTITVQIETVTGQAETVIGLTAESSINSYSAWSILLVLSVGFCYRRF